MSSTAIAGACIHRVSGACHVGQGEIRRTLFANVEGGDEAIVKNSL